MAASPRGTELTFLLQQEKAPQLLIASSLAQRTQKSSGDHLLPLKMGTESEKVQKVSDFLLIG